MQLLTLAGILVVFSSVAVQGTEKNVGPCMKEKIIAGPSMPGKYIPQCMDTGFYKPIQCHSSTGLCWCANPDDGKKVESAGVFHNREVIRCPMCHIKRAEALRPGLVGGYIPQCDEYGLYTPAQRHGSIGHTWCVDPRTGDEVQGTRRKAGEQTVECDSVAAMAAPARMQQSSADTQGPCKSKQQRQGKLGAFQPQCTENGYFRTEQRHSSTGSTWCVHPVTGSEITATRRGPTETKATCGACFKDIEEQLHPERLHGAQMPQCNEENGDYHSVQFREGFKFCVNPKTGALTGKIYHVADNTSMKCDKN